jgi:hypothetical protein
MVRGKEEEEVVVVVVEQQTFAAILKVVDAIKGGLSAYPP